MKKPYKFTILCISSVIAISFLYCLIMTTFDIALSLKFIALGFILAMLATVSIGTHIFIKMFAQE